MTYSHKLTRIIHWDFNNIFIGKFGLVGVKESIDAGYGVDNGNNPKVKLSLVMIRWIFRLKNEDKTQTILSYILEDEYLVLTDEKHDDSEKIESLINESYLIFVSIFDQKKAPTPLRTYLLRAILPGTIQNLKKEILQRLPN